MGEIKSTLDLVLEKTMHLSLSSEEKQELAVEDIEKRIKGMMQKYQDGILTLDELQKEYRVIKTDENLAATRSLIREVIDRLDLLEANEPLLEVLGKLCGCHTDDLQSVIDESLGIYRDAARKRSDELKSMLAADHSISGSAVVPNLEADMHWRQATREILAEYENQLNRVRDNLLDGIS
jgi:hypothetical protein